MIDVGRETPAVWIRQGPAPRSWLTGETEEGEERVSRVAPSGLMLSAGVGGARFADAVAQACGDAGTCSGQQLRGAAAANATYWIAPFFAADVGYVRPGQVTANGSGTGFSFSNTLEARIITVAAKVGGQVGPVRIYGIGGANFSFATSTTIQTPTGGSPATFAFRAEGWGWLGGGGAEFWLTSRLALYGEGEGMALKGSAIDNRQGSISDTIIFGTFGARFAIRPKAAPTGQ